MSAPTYAVQTRRVADCLNCGRRRPIAGGGQCSACWRWQQTHGEPRPHEALPPTRSDHPAGFLTSRQVCDEVGISYRQIDYWCRAGLLVPSGGELPHQRNSGLTWWWTDGDVARLRAVKARIDFGLTVEAAFRTFDPGPCPPPMEAAS